MTELLKVCPVCGRKERWHQIEMSAQVGFECGAVYEWCVATQKWEPQYSEDGDNTVYYCPYATDVVMELRKQRDALLEAATTLAALSNKYGDDEWRAGDFDDQKKAMDIIADCEREQLAQRDKCPNCDGAGWNLEQGANGEPEQARCEKCWGTGTLVLTQSTISSCDKESTYA